MVAPGRVELPTFGLGNRCSIHLSYGATCEIAPLSHVDLSTQAWRERCRSVQFGFRARPENREIPLFA